MESNRENSSCCPANHAISFLETLLHSDLEPADAVRLLQQNQKWHGVTQRELVWTPASQGRKWQFQLIVHLDDDKSLLIEIAEKSNVPWVLHGSTRWNDRIIVKVGPDQLEVKDLMAMLEITMRGKGLAEKLVNESIISRELQRRSFEVTSDELQMEMDQFRTARNLLTRQSFLDWLSERSIDQSRLEHHLETKIATEKLREEICSGNEEPYFERHRDDLDCLSVLEIRANDHAAAKQIQKIVSTNQTIDDVISSNLNLTNLFGSSMRVVQYRKCNLPLSMKRFLSPENIGSWFGPIEITKGFEMYRLLGHLKAEFDEETREWCKTLLFEKWLQNKRNETEIQWFWYD